MADKRKLRGKAKRASYFIRSASGEFIYQGPLYEARQKGKITPERALTLRWIMGFVITALWLVEGCMSVPGMNGSALVLPFYVAGLISGAMLFWAAMQMGFKCAPLREYVYDATVKQFPIRTMAVAICAGLTLIGEGICLALNGVGRAAPAMIVLFFLFLAVILALSILWYCMERQFFGEK